MKVFLLLLCLFGWPASLAAQLMPHPSDDTPQIRTVQFAQGARVLLTMLPDTPLTIILEPDQSIAGVTPGDGDDFKIRVAADRGSFMVLPTPEARAGTLNIATQNRTYTFMLRVEASQAAALVVRFVDPPALHQTSLTPEDSNPVSLETWSYRLRGDRDVRPAHVADDGFKTRISYAPGQALPAVFAIGPTGEEEVVNGYMRGDVFVIDRVYGELVFRIDKDKATARRNEAPEEAP